MGLMIFPNWWFSNVSFGDDLQSALIENDSKAP